MTFYAVFFVIMALAGFIIQREIVPFSPLTFLLFVLAAISYIVNGEDPKYFVILCSYFVLSIFFTLFIDFKTFANTYVKVMHVIALASLVLYVINMLAPAVLEILPTVKNVLGLQAHTVFISISPINGRNYGMFWEPGAFQTFLAFALLVEFLILKSKNKFRIISLIAALITTFSTTGYIALILIVVAITASAIFDNSDKKNLLITLSAILIFFYAATQIIAEFYPHLDHTLFGKIRDFISQDFEEYSSLGVRYNSFFGAFEIFKQNILTGVGNTNFRSQFLNLFGHTMTTCTPMNWFAMFGTGYGVLSFYSFIKFTGFFSNKWLVRILVLAILLVIIISEDYVLNPSVMVWTMYGLTHMSKAKNENLEGSVLNENITN